MSLKRLQLSLMEPARLDVKAPQGFWGSKSTKDYFDIKVFNPHARSYRSRPIQAVFSQLELVKKKKL
jgi:hypothetical protein